jgi:anti-sigma factor ChrR (cupin superfamily)
LDTNIDFDKRVSVHAGDNAWLPSPMAGVDRKLLDRLGGEVARATTIVRYAPGSSFAAHTHTGGEEFIVLEGVFQDEHGDYPEGTYVRNPPTTYHTPRSDEGCVIFVKLWQFDPDDRNQFSKGIEKSSAAQTLHQDSRETVTVRNLNPGEVADMTAEGGVELLLLKGGFTEGGERFSTHSWLRVPDGYRLSLEATEDGAQIWVKTGHLRFVQRPD